MLVALLTRSTGVDAPQSPGDIVNTSETPKVINNAIAYQYTGQDLVNPGPVYRTGIGGAGADLWPTAQQIVDAAGGSMNDVTPPGNELYGVQPSRSVLLAWPANLNPFGPGASFRQMLVQTTAFAVTMTVPANSGIIVAAAPLNVTTIAASSWREYLFRILAAAPTQIIGCNGVNGQLTLTVPSGYLSLINNLVNDMSVYGTNIGANARITSINRDTGVIGVSVANTGAITLGSITFTPTVEISGLRSGTL